MSSPTPRFDFKKESPGANTAMQALEAYLRTCSIEVALIHLIKLRASQLNGCAYCIDMHWKDLRAIDVSEDKLYMLNAWRESSLYSDRERAALAWTETVTVIGELHAPDAAYDDVRKHLSETEVSDLTVAIATINAWNRLAISARTTPGRYQAKHG
ncbi:MAG: carboxymuconolactone decarboxylase family protein [bacterium]